MVPRRRTAAMLGVGLLGGLISGLLGVGGGVILVPGLVLVFGLEQRRAHAVSLAAIVPIGAIGAIVYATTGDGVDLAIAGSLAAGAIVGAPLGVRALAAVRADVLRVAFVAVAMVVGLRLLFVS